VRWLRDPCQGGPDGDPGVVGVEVALSTGNVDVSYDERLARPAQMASAVEKAGYSVNAAAIDVASKSKGCC
jgi:hypothetical protein